MRPSTSALRKSRRYSDGEWDAIGVEAAAIRKQLFDLTGDAYGRPKIKLVRPSDDELEANYTSASEIPKNVRAWIQRNASLLTSDASDAVRLMRIADTLRDERYPSGEITIYRAVATGDEIRPGDWVSTDRQYVEEHLRRWLDGKGHILEDVVDGRDVLASPTGNYEEAIYAPREFSGPIEEAARTEVEKSGAVDAPRM